MTEKETRELINERFRELRINELPDQVYKLEVKFEHLRSELKGDIAGLRSELKGDIASLREDIADIKASNKIMLRIMYFIFSALLIGLIKYLFFS